MTAEPVTGPAPGSVRADRPDGVRWFSGPSLKLHATMLAGVLGCAAATWFEWTRATSGHQIAWAYVFEWPLFAVLGLHVWWKLLHADARRPRAARPVPAPTTDQPDAGLAAWQAYLRRLHESDPPGGPPPQNAR
ncbi:MAG: hypothetical protein ACXVX8_05685 [Blastococcus sp.]